MLDTIREQQQDIKLFEQICRTLLSNKKMNQIFEKAQWSADDDEWILPYFKADGDVGDNTSSRLPGIGKDAALSPKLPSTGMHLSKWHISTLFICIFTSGAPGIAFPRNISSESKNHGGGGSSLPPAFGRKSRSGDDDDSKRSKDLQLPEFNSRTTLPSTLPSGPLSARSEVASRDSRNDSGDGEKKKKKKKKEKPYNEEMAKHALAAALVGFARDFGCYVLVYKFVIFQDNNDAEDSAGVISDWGFADSSQGDENAERKRRNRSSSGTRKSKVLLFLLFLVHVIIEYCVLSIGI